MGSKRVRKTNLILNQGIRGLGSAGAVVSVKPGYARNFLVPHGIAYIATKEAIKAVEQKKVQLMEEDAERLKSANKLAEQIKSLQLCLSCSAGESGRLFGSVRRSSIASLFKEAEIEISEKDVFVPNPIKSLGDHVVFVDLHPQCRVKVVVSVEKAHS